MSALQHSAGFPLCRSLLRRRVQAAALAAIPVDESNPDAPFLILGCETTRSLVTWTPLRPRAFVNEPSAPSHESLADPACEAHFGEVMTGCEDGRRCSNAVVCPRARWTPWGNASLNSSVVPASAVLQLSPNPNSRVRRRLPMGRAAGLPARSSCPCRSAFLISSWRCRTSPPPDPNSPYDYAVDRHG